MKYSLFYFIVAIRTTATFSCKTCRWAGSPAVYHTVCDLLLHQGNKRGMLTRTARVM